MNGECSRGLAYLAGAPLAAIVLVLPGCFPSPKPKAASTLKCPEAQLAVEDNSTGAQVVTGCGKSDVIVMEGTGKMTSLRERATFELSCPDEQIDLKILSPSLFGVTGCGHKVMYKYVTNVGIVVDTAQSASTNSPSAPPVK
jgi:hypothetical protein